MNVRNVTKGDREKGNENVLRKMHVDRNTAQKPFVFQNVSKCSPQLSDKSEFPSLSETSEKVSSNSQPTGTSLRYSDKLKLQSTAQNQKSVSNFLLLKNDPVVNDTYKVLSHSTSSSHCVNKWFHNGNKINFNENVTFQTKQNEPEKSGFEKVVNVNLSRNIPKSQSNHALRQSHSSQYNDNKNQSPKQKHLLNTSDSKLCTTYKTSTKNSNSTSLLSKSNSQAHYNNEVNLIVEKGPVKEDGNDASNNTTTKKKKKRKSKVKRQVALQTGKITVLTPEVHSKILNQASALASQNYRGTLTDINDEEEYPELGKSVVPASQKENYPKKESNFVEFIHEATGKSTVATIVKQPLISKDATRESAPLSTTKSNDLSVTEKKGKSENKAVHPNDPITVSFYDVLMNKGCKTKVKEVEVDNLPSIGLASIKSKKNSCHPHNLLDSSSPVVKRGKERENPKPKKPSQLKKIILLDRKVRREQFLQLKGPEENTVIGNESEQEIDTFEGNEIDVIETNIPPENNCEYNSTNRLTLKQEASEQNTFLLSFDNDDLTLHDDHIPEMKLTNISDMIERWDSEKSSNNVSPITSSIEDIKTNHFIGKIGNVIESSLDKISVKETNNCSESEVITDSSLASKRHLDASESPDLLLNCLINSVKMDDISDKEKAVKILLHTRNFREYCNHLISKDIDDVVHSLLDDLARFQDRLHQKDPVKARMKRRMIYGVKEVKKHIKLKKLKSIIVAADIESIESHGGLNDLLNDIKSSAADHHIPCVFALSRKDLGKVCRKPVPVSCVGVFNYEGSEANFKRMVELQTQSKVDYAEISSKLSRSLTEEQISNLLKAKKEAPETLRAIRTSILGDFFLNVKTRPNKHERINEIRESIRFER